MLVGLTSAAIDGGIHCAAAPSSGTSCSAHAAAGDAATGTGAPAGDAASAAVDAAAGAHVLFRFIQNFGVGDIVVGPGLNASDLHVSATSLGGVYAYNVTATNLLVANTG
jgi:hypothetical protein